MVVTYSCSSSKVVVYAQIIFSHTVAYSGVWCHIWYPFYGCHLKVYYQFLLCVYNIMYSATSLPICVNVGVLMILTEIIVDIYIYVLYYFCGTVIVSEQDWRVLVLIFILQIFLLKQKLRFSLRGGYCGAICMFLLLWFLLVVFWSHRTRFLWERKSNRKGAGHPTWSHDLFLKLVFCLLGDCS